MDWTARHPGVCGVTFLLLPRWTIWKYQGDGALDEQVDVEGNALSYGGSSAVWEMLMGRSFTPYNNANAYIGVGNGGAAPDPNQTDLQGATTIRKEMESGYPLHFPGNNEAAASIIFRAVFGPGEAEFGWKEVGLFNAAASGRMFNRRVRDLGTKPTGRTWQVSCAFIIKPEAGGS